MGLPRAPRDLCGSDQLTHPHIETIADTTHLLSAQSTGNSQLTISRLIRNSSLIKRLTLTVLLSLRDTDIFFSMVKRYFIVTLCHLIASFPDCFRFAMSAASEPSSMLISESACSLSAESKSVPSHSELSSMLISELASSSSAGSKSFPPHSPQEKTSASHPNVAVSHLVQTTVLTSTDKLK